MDGDGSGLRFAVIAVCLLISFISSGSETAFFSLSQVRIRQLTEARSRHIDIIISLKSRPDVLLGTILLCNTVVNILATSAISDLFPMSEIGQTLASVVATVMLLVFGEVTPKAIATHNPEQFSFTTAPVMLWFVRILSPVVHIMNVFNPAQHRQATTSSTDEVGERILVAASIGEQSGELEPAERLMINNILTINMFPVSRIMHPIKQAITVTSASTVADVVRLAQHKGFARYPVLDAGRPMGVLLVSDLLEPLRKGQTHASIRPWIRPIARYYEAKPISSLLQQMRKEAEQLVLISSPEGKITGFVTMEDIIEQYIGDIRDEYDVPSKEGTSWN